MDNEPDQDTGRDDFTYAGHDISDSEIDADYAYPDWRDADKNDVVDIELAREIEAALKEDSRPMEDPSRRVATVLSSFLPLGDKTKYKLAQTPSTDLFRTIETPIGGKVHKMPSSGSSERPVRIMLNKSNLAKRNQIKQPIAEDEQPSSQQIHGFIQKTTPEHQKPRTIIVDSVAELKPQQADKGKRKRGTPRSTNRPTIIKKPLMEDPSLFTLDMNILPGYGLDQKQAESVVQGAILNTVKSRIISLKKSEVTPPQRGDSSSSSSSSSSTNTSTQAPVPQSHEQTFVTTNVNAWVKYTNEMKKHFFTSEKTSTNTTAGGTHSSTVQQEPSQTPHYSLALPNIETLERRYIQDFLREAIPILHERPCMNGDNCESVALWYHVNSKYPIHAQNQERMRLPGGSSRLLSETPFILRELILPSECKTIKAEWKKGRSYKVIIDELPPRKCILCNLCWTERLSNLQKSQLNQEPWFPIQNHCNEFDKPGEYLGIFKKASGFAFCGILKPILTYDKEHYLMGQYYVWMITGISTHNTTKTRTDNDDEMLDETNQPDNQPENDNVKSLTTPIPAESSQVGSRPPNQLIQYACDELNSDQVYTQVVNGWLEIEDIICRPRIDEPYVRAVTDTFGRLVSEKHK